MEKKYKLTDETINVGGKKLYRIEALKDFRDVKKGYKGGFIEDEYNLSHDGNSWVFGDAMVYGDARVCGDAWVCGDAMVYGGAMVDGSAIVCGGARVYGNSLVYDGARVCGDAMVYGDARVCDGARVCGDAMVYGGARVCGDAKIENNSDYIVFKNWWSSGRYFTWTRSNDMWKVGCFYGNGEELIKKAYQDSEKSGREYERVVKYIDEIKKENYGK